jgi:nucleoside 2-deoxyribosyltransferase
VSTEQPKVFLSYSHRDRRWADRLLTHLRAIADNVSVWSDAQIKVGESWHDEISRAITTADVAILLISADYLASDFIANQELPTLLESASQGRTLILPVMISPAFLDPASPLVQFQFVNDPHRPLSALKPSEQDEVFTAVARVIQQRLPKLARQEKTGKPPVDPASHLAPLVEEIAARVVKLLGSDQALQPRAPGKPAPPATSPDSNLVFVVMSFSDDMEPIFEGIAAAAASVGLEAKRVKDVSGDYRITDKIMEMILSSRFVVVDLTHERPNVYFELGYARASGKTVITIARRETQIHFDVKDWTYIPYIDSRTLERDLRERLRNELQR